MLIWNMTNMNVERYSIWSRIRIMEAKFIHSTFLGLKFELVPGCSFEKVYCITSRRGYLQEIQGNIEATTTLRT